MEPVLSVLAEDSIVSASAAALSSVVLFDMFMLDFQFRKESCSLAIGK